jgi:hypothetical protein
VLLQGTTEAAVHTLQTGWCFYAGLESAKRSNVWLASQSPTAVAMTAAAGPAPGRGSPMTPQRPPPAPGVPNSLMQVVGFAMSRAA